MVNFHHSAQNIFLEDGHILVAELGNLDGDYVESRLDLDYYIGNDDGSFTWGGEGKFPFSSVCYPMQVMAFLNPRAT